MKKAWYLFSVCTLLALGACQSDRPNEGNENLEEPTEQETPVKLIEYLIGEGLSVER